jgi:hypothetical protein
VPLAAVADPGQVLAGIARAVGADQSGTGSPVQALAELFWDDVWLLILDNLEQVAGVAPDLGDLLARCPGVAILATSRTALGLRAEREYPVPPLPLPADPAAASLADIAASPAVALFVDRARAVRPGFALTAGQRGGGRGDLPPPGGAAAGHRAGRAAGPAVRVAGRAERGRGRYARAPADAAGHGRMERGPADRRRAVAAGGRGGVHRRLDH